MKTIEVLDKAVKMLDEKITNADINHFTVSLDEVSVEENDKVYAIKITNDSVVSYIGGLPVVVGCYDLKESTMVKIVKLIKKGLDKKYASMVSNIG